MIESIIAKALLTAWLAGQTLDLATTFIALDRGMVEANPALGQSKRRIGGVKVVVNGAALYAYFKAKGRKRMIISGAMAGAGLAAGLSNAGKLRQ